MKKNKSAGTTGFFLFSFSDQMVKSNGNSSKNILNNLTVVHLFSMYITQTDILTLCVNCLS